MGRKERISIVLHAVEILYSLIVLAWFAIPLAEMWLPGPMAEVKKIVPLEGLFSALQMPDLLFGGREGISIQQIVATVIVFFIPAICLLKIISPFLHKPIPWLAAPYRRLPTLLNFTCSGLVLAVIITGFVRTAHSAEYFRVVTPVLYGLVGISLIYNAFSLFAFLARSRAHDTTYQEVMAFKRSPENRLRGVGIQNRLILIFVPLILLIIGVLSFVLMQSFANAMLASVIQNGKDLADRTALAIKVNPGDMIGADDYLSSEAQRNLSSALPFQTISYYLRDPGTETFSIQASTDRSLMGGKAAGAVSPFTEGRWRFNPESSTFEFDSPITLSGKFLGYIEVNFSREVIFEPYFRTQVKVILIAAAFIYASIFLIFISGRSIVFPIRLLHMSVNSIANTLSGMVKGKVKVSQELLTYTDKVGTRDEIKSLSKEVGNMTTVIRGIVPYISTSTLKYSERQTPTTETRDLTFLFTDIRGFTTLCEGMKADKVVEMLNHYLEIQANVITANGGDIDKYVGDEVMAMFEGARKEANACKTAMEIRKAMAEEKELATLEKTHAVSIGIGLNTGSVSFGSVGAKERMDFTSIGDTVNLAARLEGANKTYGTKTLITEAVFQKVKSSYLCREIDLLTVKGKTQPVRIFELLQQQKQAADKLDTIKENFEQGLELYRAQKWQAAEKVFASLKDEFEDETSAIFLRRIAFFKKNPPPDDWDGVFNLTVK
jgi:class 3 adenylate cyclase